MCSYVHTKLQTVWLGDPGVRAFFFFCFGIQSIHVSMESIKYTEIDSLDDMQKKVSSFVGSTVFCPVSILKDCGKVESSNKTVLD